MKRLVLSLFILVAFTAISSAADPLDTQVALSPGVAELVAPEDNAAFELAALDALTKHGITASDVRSVELPGEDYFAESSNLIEGGTCTTYWIDIHIYYPGTYITWRVYRVSYTSCTES